MVADLPSCLVAWWSLTRCRQGPSLIASQQLKLLKLLTFNQRCGPAFWTDSLLGAPDDQLRRPHRAKRSRMMVSVGWYQVSCAGSVMRVSMILGLTCLEGSLPVSASGVSLLWSGQ